MTHEIYLPTGIARPGIAGRLARTIEALDPAVHWVVTIARYKKRRSTAQNAYLWGVVYPTIIKGANLEGWDAEEVHEWCLGEWSGWETLTGLGRAKVRPIRRSSKLNTQEFSDYVAFIQRTMAVRGIYIPDPNEEV